MQVFCARTKYAIAQGTSPLPLEGGYKATFVPCSHGAHARKLTRQCKDDAGLAHSPIVRIEEGGVSAALAAAGVVSVSTAGLAAGEGEHAVLAHDQLSQNALMVSLPSPTGANNRT